VKSKVNCRLQDGAAAAGAVAVDFGVRAAAVVAAPGDSRE